MTYKLVKLTQKIIDKILSQYPKGKSKSAILPLMDLIQRKNNNYLSKEAIEYVADIISVPYIKAYEVASFYTMFNLKPVGKYHIKICGTTPCWLKGSDKIKHICEKTLKIRLGQTSNDNMFTLSEVECLGACVNAPMIQINDDYYEDLDEKSMERIIGDLKSGKQLKVGSQIGRQSSMAANNE
tara:strand:+ start:165 stop:713 length:549 start_codon:yes stop_codon:yes gene_type:complete